MGAEAVRNGGGVTGAIVRLRLVGGEEPCWEVVEGRRRVEGSGVPWELGRDGVLRVATDSLRALVRSGGVAVVLRGGG